jgi:hypothetical protein
VYRFSSLNASEYTKCDLKPRARRRARARSPSSRRCTPRPFRPAGGARPPQPARRSREPSGPSCFPWDWRTRVSRSHVPSRAARCAATPRSAYSQSHPARSFGPPHSSSSVWMPGAGLNARGEQPHVRRTHGPAPSPEVGTYPVHTKALSAKGIRCLEVTPRPQMAGHSSLVQCDQSFQISPFGHRGYHRGDTDIPFGDAVARLRGAADEPLVREFRVPVIAGSVPCLVENPEATSRVPASSLLDDVIRRGTADWGTRHPPPIGLRNDLGATAVPSPDSRPARRASRGCLAGSGSAATSK